jgi:hypothetical protein
MGPEASVVGNYGAMLALQNAGYAWAAPGAGFEVTLLAVPTAVLSVQGCLAGRGGRETLGSLWTRIRQKCCARFSL